MLRVQRATTKLAKELIALNPPQDELQTQATLGLVVATCKRGGFVLQRATKPAKEMIAQDPPQDDLQTQATLGLVVASCKRGGFVLQRAIKLKRRGDCSGSSPE